MMYEFALRSRRCRFYIRTTNDPMPVPCSGNWLYQSDTEQLWLSTADDWLPVNGEGGETVPALWGDITGTLSEQVDLQEALDAKQDHDEDLVTLAEDITSFGHTLVSAAGSAAARAALGLEIGTHVQAADATLVALAALNADAGVVEQTGADTFTKRPIGVASASSIPTRSDGDSRWAASGHNHDGSYSAVGHNHDAQYAAIDHEHEGGPGGIDILDVYPVGSIYTTVDSGFDPGATFGGTWEQFGGGRVLVGQTAGDSDFNVAEETGGAKTVTLTAAQSGLPQHTHTQDSHNHTQDAHTHTQNAHTHVQDAHTHTQNAHNHAMQRFPTATGGSTGFTVDTSMSGTEASANNTANTTATNQNATAVNQNATAVNQNATATNQAATAVNQDAGPTAAAEAHSNVQPYIVVYFWKRTA